MFDCPYCSQKLDKGELGYFCRACSFSIPFVYRGQRLSEEVLNTLFSQGKSCISEWTRQDTGETFLGYLELSEEKSVRLVPSYLEGGMCPLCGEKILETSKTWTCVGGDLKVWKSMASLSISKQTVKQLLLYKKTDQLNGFVSKETGKRFSASLRIESNGEVVFDFGN